MDAKPVLRSRMKAARTRRDHAELDRLAELIAREGMTRAADVNVVAAYAGVGTEPPTHPLLDALAGAGRTVLLPVVTPTGVKWGRYEGWDALRRQRGLLEPTGGTTDDLSGVELVFAPALAVDRSGNRLGRGGGYYDRALVGVSPGRIVAVVFADEVLDVVPVQAHDIRVGAALTPEGIIEF